MSEFELKGKDWSVYGCASILGGYHAVVKVGSTTKVTQSYETLQEAHDVGCQLLADTKAELQDLVDA